MVKQERLEKLLDATIKNYFEEVNPDDEFSLYDAMYEHLLNGDLDNVFIAPKLEDKSYSVREEAFDLARKYGYLCFYNGDYKEYLLESVENTDDIDLVSMEVLDNYNFLVELALEKGELALKEISKFQAGTMAEETAVVEYLRNTFFNDEALKECLELTSYPDGKFDHIPLEAKESLYRFPQGVLYFDHGDQVEINTFEGLLKDIINHEEELMLTNTSALENMENLEEVVGYLGTGIFDEFVERIYLDYEDAKKHGNVNNSGAFHR